MVYYHFYMQRKKQKAFLSGMWLMCAWVSIVTGLEVKLLFRNKSR